MVEGILVDGLIFALMAMGVFITFRILDFPDLTVDGSFATGAAVVTMSITGGLGIFPGLLLAFLSGAAAGTVTAVIHNRLKVPNLLAGILTMTMLYSINIRVLGGRANVALLRVDTLISKVIDLGGSVPREITLLLFMIIFTGSIKLLLDLFFHTDMGITLGAMGNNEQMVISQGVNPKTMKVLGVGLSNGLVALSGAMLAQYQGFADANLGVGIVVQGLAAVMLGEFLFRSNKIGMLTLQVIFGAILYKALMFFGRYYGYYINLTPSDLKLLTGLLVIASLVIAKSRKNKPVNSSKRGGGTNA
ncbi:MAG: ABC transporter permease [Spirochaetia bacterium]|nr:ABC transporter permease [Spirochaetia bacterium]